jgi:pyrroloquinoline quinone (PQQ) biosynthesis protein C
MNFLTQLISQESFCSLNVFKQVATGQRPFQRLSRQFNKAAKIRNVQNTLDQQILRAAKETLSDYSAPPLTPDLWAFKLATFYYLTHFTSSFMKTAAQGFLAQNRLELAFWAYQKSAEEANHDQLALQDIAAMGYDPAGVIESFHTPSISSLIDYFRSSVESVDPLAAVGYCYAMERIAMSIRKEHIQSVVEMLPTGASAVSCLRVHSAEGSDVSHVKETVEVISQLSERTRSKIAEACYKTSLLHFENIKRGTPSQSELRMRLSRFKQKRASPICAPICA